VGIGSNPFVFEEAAGEEPNRPPTPDASGGEATSSGGMAVQLLRVFIENKLAVVGAIIIVLFILFCFVGPVFYHSNQTTPNKR